MTAADLRVALRTLVEALPAGAPGTFTAPREALLELLGDEQPSSSGPADPRLLTPEEVAERLRVEKQWVYRRAKKWPFTRRLGRRLVIDAAGLEKWLARQSPR